MLDIGVNGVLMIGAMMGITVLGLDAVRTDVLTICCAPRCVRKMRCEKVWC